MPFQANSSSSSIQRGDSDLTGLERKLCVPVSTLDIYLSLAPNQPPSKDKEALIRECQVRN